MLTFQELFKVPDNSNPVHGWATGCKCNLGHPEGCRDPGLRHERQVPEGGRGPGGPGECHEMQT